MGIERYSADVFETIRTEIANPILKFILAVAVIYFLYGVAQFIINREDSSKAGEGKQHMLWGLIGLAIIISVFGVVNLISSFLGGLK